jgi:hypothetical protein
MKNKKIVWGIIIILIVLVLLVMSFILWGLPKSMGSIKPFLNMGDVFSFGDGERPGKPAYYQFGLDCSTGDLVIPGELIQPDFGCDVWQANRFERPFNAVSQDEYYPDIDIQYAYFGRDADWYYLRFALFDPQPGTEFLAGTYAIEMDLDVDGRGDLLVLVSEPGKDAGEKWSTQGVQVWTDSNNDVGGQEPDFPEEGLVADGYDTLLFDQGAGNDPNGAWARAFMTGSAYVELAFKIDYLGGDIAFKWWVWAGHESYTPGLFEIHDFYSHEQAGDPNKGMDFFPSNEIFAIDSSCANMWGASPDPADPDYCFSFKEPVDDSCVLLKCLIPLLPCKIPGDKPGDNPCVLPFEEWVILIWGPGHPGQLVSEQLLWKEYEAYLKKPFCPPEDSITPTPTPIPTNTPTPTLIPTDTPTPTLVPTDTPTPIPTDTPTPTATKIIPPPPQCTKNYSKKKCIEVGGKWVEGGMDVFGRPLPGYCECP